MSIHRQPLPSITSRAFKTNTTCSAEDGIYTDATAPETVEVPTTTADGKPTTAPAKPKKNRTLLTIPSQVISRAVGLAIFTTARAGFHVSGATGSGVLVARLPDGSWSPPSGIQVHSVGAGFMIGIDIYDCVVVINTREALAAFTKTRMSLGSDLAITAGPWGAGGSVDFAAPQGKGKGKAKTEDGQTGPEAAAEGTVKDAEGKPASPPATGEKTGAEAVSTPAASEQQQQQQQSTAAPAPSANTSGTPAAQRPAGNQRKASEAIKSVIKQPTYSYVKSRGFYAGVQVDGTIVTERKDANAAFYGEPVAVQQIMHGDVPLVPGNENWVNIVKPLFDTIRGAEGWHGQQQGGAGGNWSGENSPGSPTGYPTGFDPVSDRTDAAPPAKPPRPSSGGAVAGATAGVAAMHLDGSSGAPPTSTTPSTAGETPAARAKAAEAAAEAEMNREREARERREAEADMVPPPAAAPPGYSEMARPGEVPGTGGVDAEHSATATGAAPPPAYADDGVARPGVGDTKGAPSA